LPKCHIFVVAVLVLILVCEDVLLAKSLQWVFGWECRFLYVFRQRFGVYGPCLWFSL